MRPVKHLGIGLLLGTAYLLVLPAVAAAQNPQPGNPTYSFAPDSWIGISVTDAAPDKPEGVVVAQVEADTPAAKAGVKVGDVLVEFDGERVRSASQLTRLVRETPAGRAVKMVVMRDGKRIDLTVTPEARSSGTYRFRVPSPFGDRPFPFPPNSRRLVPSPAPGFDIDPEIVPPQWRRPGAVIGIGVQDLTPQLRDYFGTKDGVLVASVTDGSPAARAGLKAGDVITAIDGREVRTAGEVRSALAGKQQGDQVRIGLTRNHRAQTLTVAIDNR